MPGVAVLDKKIYVTGGYDDGLPVSSCDVYDTDTNTWSQVPSMNIGRHGHSLVSLHGRLYAIGGYNDVDSVEVFTPGDDNWSLSQHKLDGEVAYNGAGLIKKCILNQDNV